VNQIRLGGGGARSKLWRQIQADVYGREVATVRAEEGAAYGAAILAGVGAGAWSSVDAACEAVVSVADRVKHNADSARLLEKQYARFSMIYPALRAVS
jgi:xylulokinase